MKQIFDLVLAAHDRLELRLIDNVLDGVCAQRVVQRNRRHVVCITTVLRENLAGVKKVCGMCECVNSLESSPDLMASA